MLALEIFFKIAEMTFTVTEDNSGTIEGNSAVQYIMYSHLLQLYAYLAPFPRYQHLHSLRDCL